MQRDGVVQELDFEVDPVVSMDVKWDVRYCDLECTVPENQSGPLRCILQLRFGPEEGARDPCIVSGVEEQIP
jgi:hypothetical protein